VTTHNCIKIKLLYVGLVEQTIVGLISALGRAFVISSFG
jgi:hypothetical protein